MVDSNVFVRSNSLRGLTEISTSTGPVVETWDALAPRIEAAAGPEAASFFARPAIVRGNGETETGISWYVPRPGGVRTWGSLSPDERVQAGAEVARILERLRPALEDPQTGPILQQWLNVSSLGDDLVFVGGRPHLLNWGLVPEAVAGDPAALHAHSRNTLGLFGAGAQHAGATAFTEGAPRRAFAGATAAAVAGGGAASADGSTTPAPVPVAAAPSRAWIPLLVAVIVAALLLLLLSIPGVLVYPREEPVVARGPSLDPAVVGQVEDTLRRRIAALQSELGTNACRVVDAEGVPPTLGDLGAAPPVVAGTPTPPVVSPPPATLPSPPPSPAPPPGTDIQPPGNLLEFLDRGTALVLAPRADGQGLSMGSAFFVNERQLVTNYHVLSEAIGDRTSVVSPALDSMVPARVVVTSEGHDFGTPDFAVLEIEPTASRQVLTLADPVDRMQNVIAVGYPGFVMQTDAVFHRLQQGDRTAIPEPVVTQGSVMALQTGQSELPLVYHTATIAQGNSGGPLVDVCGRVVGVNTFGRLDRESVLRLNVALQTRGLREFLDRHGISYTSSAEACAPVAVASAPPPQATAPTEADPVEAEPVEAEPVEAAPAPPPANSP